MLDELTKWGLLAFLALVALFLLVCAAYAGKLEARAERKRKDRWVK